MFKPYGSRATVNYPANDYAKAEPGLDNSFRRQQVNLPATMFNKSPYKDRQNRPNVGNTPIRKLGVASKPVMSCVDSNKRISISPLKHQRQNSNMGNDTATKERPLMMDHSNSSSKILSQNSTVLGKTMLEAICSNHSNKTAKFVIQIEDEELPYCQKCAILLASQGFRVNKLEEMPEPQPIQAQSAAENDENSPRRLEINQFLDDLSGVMHALEQKKEEIEEVVKKSDVFYESQFTIVNAYYGRLSELINSHRQVVEKALRQEKQKSQKEAQESLGILTEAITHSNNMKDDILTSLDLIKEADEKAFRPVMQAYKKDTKKFRQTTNRIAIPSVVCKKIGFSDLNQVRDAIVSNIQVQFRGEGSEVGKKSPQPEISNIESVASISSANFSFEAKMAAELGRDYCSGVLEHDEYSNPLVQSEEYSKDNKFMKSSLKQSSNGLFAADFNE